MLMLMLSAGCGTGHTSTVWSVCFDASGDCLASCSDDLTLRVWQCMQRPGGRVEWRCGATLSGYHARAIYTLHWGPVNGIIATGEALNACDHV